MKSETAHSEIRSALRAELKRRHGQIGQIEAAMDRSEGYLSRFCRGDMEISLKGLLDALEILEIEPGSFFGSSLGGVCTSVVLLKRNEGCGCQHKSVGPLEETLSRLEDGDVEPEDAQRLHRVCLEEFLDQPLSARIRRLKSSRKYRQEEFVVDLLRHLDRYRFENPSEAVKLLVTVVDATIPVFGCTERRQYEIFCHAVGVLSSALRQAGEFRPAVAAARIGLEFAKKHRLDGAVTDLLERSSYALGSLGRHAEALAVLREGVEVAFETDDRQMLGRLAMAQGLMHSYLGRPDRSERCLRRSLELLPAGDASVERWRVAALQNLSRISSEQGDLEGACQWLAAAVESLATRGDLMHGKLLWQKGSIELVGEQFRRAEESLRGAYDIFETLESPEFALVSVDLVKTLWVQGRRSEAVDIAKKMAAIIGTFDQSDILEAAVLEFLRVVLQGELTEAVVDEYRLRLKQKVAERA